MNQVSIEETAEICIVQATRAMDLARSAQEQAEAFRCLRSVVADAFIAAEHKETKRDMIDNIDNMTSVLDGAATLMDRGPLPDNEAVDLFIELLTPRIGELLTGDLVIERAKNIAAALQGRLLREPK